jgi:hypothetical protein
VSTIAQGVSEIWTKFSFSMQFLVSEMVNGDRRTMEIPVSDKKAKKEMERATLARVKKVMALPRMTKSAREALLEMASA